MLPRFNINRNFYALEVHLLVIFSSHGFKKLLHYLRLKNFDIVIKIFTLKYIFTLLYYFKPFCLCILSMLFIDFNDFFTSCVVACWDDPLHYCTSISTPQPPPISMNLWFGLPLNMSVQNIQLVIVSIYLIIFTSDIPDPFASDPQFPFIF